MPTKRRSSHPRYPSPILCVLAVLSIATSWILFVGSIRLNEMIVGALVLLSTLAFLYGIWHAESLKLTFQFQDLIQAWRIPWYVIARDYEILVILMHDCFGEPAGSFFRVSGFETGKSDGRHVARRVLATVYTTMAPNFIVIGIDYRQSRMLFHQIRRGSISLMTKELGARPRKQRS